MPLPDSSAVDEALVSLLSADAALLALCPNGVVFDLAPQGSTAFVLLSLLDGTDIYSQLDPKCDPAPLVEERTYLVKAVNQNTSGNVVKQAAYRIQQLLQHARYPITGYLLLNSERVEPIRYTELDQGTGLRWQHRGGQYVVRVTPT